MTDVNGSGQAAPEPGTPNPTNGSGGEGSTPAAAAEPFSGLDTGTREWVEKKGYKGVGDLATAARNAESLIGRSVQLPGDDAKPEDVDAFIERATAKMRPADASGYEFALPEGLPENLPYDNAFADEFKPVAHAAKLTGKQAQAVHDFYVGKAGAMFQAEADTIVKDVEAATDALEKQWGARGSDEHRQHGEAALRALKAAGDDVVDALANAKVIYKDADGTLVARNANLANWLSQVGRSLYGEDTLEAGTSGGSVDNPFAADGDKVNYTKIHQTIRNDPSRARRLMVAAGKKPADFGLAENFGL